MYLVTLDNKYCEINQNKLCTFTNNYCQTQMKL